MHRTWLFQVGLSTNGQVVSENANGGCHRDRHCRACSGCFAGSVSWSKVSGLRRRPHQSRQYPYLAGGQEFRGDLFTFVRIRYRSTWERQSLAWYTDYPDADLNMSFRLQQFTSLKVNPEPKVVEITDPDLFDYPWAS